MKFLVLSDSHGNLAGVKEAVKKYGKNADVIIHCGDSRNEAEWLMENCADSSVVCVRGNCDWGCNLDTVEFLTLAGKKIMVTHGHLFSVKYGLDNLSYSAEENGADIVFFGHTHMPTDEIVGNVRLINPGSASSYERNCATVEIDDNGNVLVNHLKIPG